MKDVTKRHFRNLCIFLFLTLAMFLILMILYIGTGNFIYSIPWAIISLGILIMICVHFRFYLNYKNNTNILEGIITNVAAYKVYHIVIKSGDKNYVATYQFIILHKKDIVGRKCSFVVNKKGKAYIKDIE